MRAGNLSHHKMGFAIQFCGIHQISIDGPGRKSRTWEGDIEMKGQECNELWTTYRMLLVSSSLSPII